MMTIGWSVIRFNEVKLSSLPSKRSLITLFKNPPVKREINMTTAALNCSPRFCTISGLHKTVLLKHQEDKVTQIQAFHFHIKSDNNEIISR